VTVTVRCATQRPRDQGCAVPMPWDFRYFMLRSSSLAYAAFPLSAYSMGPSWVPSRLTGTAPFSCRLDF
jgi:hypothetical protein